METLLIFLSLWAAFCHPAKDAGHSSSSDNLRTAGHFQAADDDPRRADHFLPADDFRLVRQRGDISLYERWVLRNGEEVRELKATFIIRAEKLRALAELLQNSSEGLRWNPQASRYEVASAPEPGQTQVQTQAQAQAPAQAQDTNNWLVYIRYDAPWPVGNHDCLLAYRYFESKTSSGTSRAEIVFSSTKDERYPVTGEASRITGTSGKWLAEDLGGSLRVTYRVTTDRSKKVPRWVSDPFVRDHLLETLAGFKNLLETRAL